MIRLDDNFTITGEKYNWVLNYEKETDKRNEKTGKLIVDKDAWYYPKLSQLLKRYLEEALKPAENIKELLEKLNSIEDRIESI